MRARHYLACIIKILAKTIHLISIFMYFCIKTEIKEWEKT